MQTSRLDLYIRTLNLPPDPHQLVHALSEQRAVSLFWLGESTAYLACNPRDQSEAFDPEPEVLCAPGAGLAFPRWVGLIPYEAARGWERSKVRDLRAPPHLCRPIWYRYGAVAEISDGVRVLGDIPEAVDQLSQLLLAKHEVSVSKSLKLKQLFVEPGEVHAARIRHALRWISEGEIYQVNLARRFVFEVDGRPWQILDGLRRRGFWPFSAALAWPGLDVMMASPELFLKSDALGGVCTSPIKGTRPRSPHPSQDAALAQELELDPKERAELAMVIDIERNDLGRVAVPGSVRLSRAPHVEVHPTVHHRLATVSARLRPGCTRLELLQAMLPSGSITGAPKVRAMDLIAELESARRGLYTGAIGVLNHDGTLTLGMAIRTLTVCQGEGHYFVGGGIVADSVPEREVEETLWKARALLDLANER